MTWELVEKYIFARIIFLNSFISFFEYVWGGRWVTGEGSTYKSLCFLLYLFLHHQVDVQEQLNVAVHFIKYLILLNNMQYSKILLKETSEGLTDMWSALLPEIWLMTYCLWKWMIQLVRTEIPFSVGTETLNYQKKGFRWELVSYSGYWYQNQYQLKCEW